MSILKIAINYFQDEASQYRGKVYEKIKKEIVEQLF